MKKPVFAFALLAFSGFINAQDTAQKSADISVLPISGPGMDKSLLTVLSDDFRSALKESGAFSVMTRELMEEIMKEQAFQMSGACDEAGCLVEAGKVIGVSKIAAVTITILPDRFFAASAQLIDVATGAVLVTASEKRQGDSYDVNKRMLRNLAAVLAGRPGQDHLDYLEAEKRSLEETRQVEKIHARRFSVSVTGFGFYPLNIVQDDNVGPRREYVTSDPDVKKWGLPEKQFNFGGEARLAYRVHPRLWIVLHAGTASIASEESYLTYRHSLDSSWMQGSTRLRMAGPYDLLTRTSEGYRRIEFGLGGRLDLFRNSRLGISLSLLPQFGYLTYWSSKLDSSFANYQIFMDSIYVGQMQDYDEVEGKSTLTSFAVGADCGLSVEYFLLANLSLSADADINFMMATALEGESKVRHILIDRDPFSTVSTDTSYTEKAAMVMGNFLHSGEYMIVDNPDNKVTDPDGRPVTVEKHAREFSGFRLYLGIHYYF